ncbi:hypothetical protein [Luteimonas suaedae]|uniref:hypothetical protein n=1 Tax=Luteimonas suaedae TaxID=2605430 RepID=UPI0011EC39B1|nr:hypothetical protein [Luteimonas suaedae]
MRAMPPNIGVPRLWRSHAAAVAARVDAITGSGNAGIPCGAGIARMTRSYEMPGLADIAIVAVHPPLAGDARVAAGHRSQIGAVRNDTGYQNP